MFFICFCSDFCESCIDALQFNSAKIAGMDCIVTRNIKDFASFDMEVMTPREFLMLIRNME